MTKMTFPIRFILILTAIAGLVAGLLVLVPVGVVQLDLDLAHLPEFYRQCQEAKQKREEMEEEGKPMLRAIYIKNRVTRQLVGGHMTLRQATSIFRYLHETPPVDHSWIFPGATPEEKYGRNVLVWARTEQSFYPKRVAVGVVERLEAELRELLAGPGGWIPEVSPDAIPELLSQCKPDPP
jgi:hypothetical protein